MSSAGRRDASSERPKGHTDRPDWLVFLDFAERYIGVL